MLLLLKKNSVSLAVFCSALSNLGSVHIYFTGIAQSKIHGIGEK